MIVGTTGPLSGGVTGRSGTDDWQLDHEPVTAPAERGGLVQVLANWCCSWPIDKTSRPLNAGQTRRPGQNFCGRNTPTSVVNTVIA